MDPLINRSFGTEPFKHGDVDIGQLRKSLQSKRPVDKLMLGVLGLDSDQLNTLTERQALEAFNWLMNSPRFFEKVDSENLDLPDETKKIFNLARRAVDDGETLDELLLKTLNKTLLHALYPNETLKKRRFTRMDTSHLIDTKAEITPLPPLDGPTVTGQILNISQGGMALRLLKPYPPDAFLALKIIFADRSEIETVAQVRHYIKKGGCYVCGFQFVSVPGYLGEQLESMSKDYIACDVRIKSQEEEICQRNCSFFNLCSKPQRLKSPSPTN